MEEFFKQFKENLENRPEPDFDKKAWQNLVQQLDRPGRRQGGLVWWWIALPLLLLLIGSNAFFYHTLQKTNNNIRNLSIQRDTVYKTKIIYQTDTIYQTRVVYETLATYRTTDTESNLYPATSSLSAPPGQEYKANAIESGTNSDAGQINGLQPGAGMENTSAAEELSAQITNIIKQPAYRSAPSPIHTPGLPVVRQQNKTGLKNSDRPLEAWIVEKNNRKKTLRQHIHAVKPEGFKVGANIGWIKPIDDDLDWKGGYSTGVEAKIVFSPRLQMWLNASYSRTTLSSNKMDEAIGIPVIPSPPDNFIFKDAEAPQPALQYAAGMQYLFNVNRKWRPFAGVGYGAVSILPYEVTYDFENESSGIEWIFEESVKRRELLTDFLLLNLGVERELSENWNWQLRTTYRTKLTEKRFRASDLLGIECGLQWRFGKK